MINNFMKKTTLIPILIIINFTLLAIGLYFFISNKDEQIIHEISKDEIDIIERSQQYNLLYSVDLKNSLKAECNWKDVSFNWKFPEINELIVYKTAIANIEIEKLDENLEPIMYESIQQAIDAFYNQYPEVSDQLHYDYQVEIFSDEKSTYEKMPLFSTVNDTTIYASNLGIWRSIKEEFIAGLYEISNSFREFIFNKDESYFSFSAKSEEDIKEAILATEIKFLNHEFLCENPNVVKSSINSIEIIYINWGEYLFPVYKVIGEFEIESQLIQWTALVNPIDFTKIDYTIYTDAQLDQTFIPRPFISNIELDNDKYYISGFLQNKLYSAKTSDSKYADSFDIQFIAKDKTGEYVYGERKEKLEVEINDSLEVNQDGKFNFNFSSDNFWQVEKVFYEDENGNEIDPYHSSDNETTRNSYDNWFKIKVCSRFEDNEYCSESSKLYYLENE